MELPLSLQLVSVLYVMQWCGTSGASGSQFTSHVRVSTPARSYSHGVGNPLPAYRGSPNRRPLISPYRDGGYPRMKPVIPFTFEESSRPRSRPPFINNAAPWPYSDKEESLRVLPVSPYRVASADPESLWPAGLFLPPLPPPRLHAQRRAHNTNIEETNDPYLLEGSDAIEAVDRAKEHGELYFHDIPHIQSLLENQRIRVHNNLPPHALGSIRHTWPFYRP